MITVRTATAAADVTTVARVLAKAFLDDPVVRWLQPDGRRGELLFRALARYQHGLRGGADLAEEDGRPVGAALWDAPGYRQSARHAVAAAIPLMRALRRRTPHGAALERAFHDHRPPGTFWYLAQIGAAVQGRGAGSALLKDRLARIDGPVYLESSNAANIPLYERFGFRLTGEIRLPFDGPSCWPMYRDPQDS